MFFADQPLSIDPLGEGGAKPGATSGAVSFKNIKFAYPTRPNMQVQYIKTCFKSAFMYTDSFTLCFFFVVSFYFQP